MPDVLREKLGADGARALAELLSQLGGQVRDAAAKANQQTPTVLEAEGPVKGLHFLVPMEGQQLEPPMTFHHIGKMEG